MGVQTEIIPQNILVNSCKESQLDLPSSPRRRGYDKTESSDWRQNGSHDPSICYMIYHSITCIIPASHQTVGQGRIVSLLWHSYQEAAALSLPYYYQFQLCLSHGTAIRWGTRMAIEDFQLRMLASAGYGTKRCATFLRSLHTERP